MDVTANGLHHTRTFVPEDHRHRTGHERGASNDLLLVAQASLAVPLMWGIATDSAGRTGIPHVWAAGDVSRPFDPRLCEHVRTEHWDAAARQGLSRHRSLVDELGLDAGLVGPLADVVARASLGAR